MIEIIYRVRAVNWNKFWLWYDVFFAVCNTVGAMLVTETRAMYLSAWCAIALVVCAGISWYAVESEVEK